MTTGSRPSQLGRLTAALAAALCMAASFALATTAHAEMVIEEFSAKAIDANGDEETQAGAHPFAYQTIVRVNARVRQDGATVPDQSLKDVVIDLPAGFVGNPSAVPKCDPQDIARYTYSGSDEVGGCPVASQIGRVDLIDALGGVSPHALYNVDPRPGLAAQFGFLGVGVTPVAIETTVRPDNGLRVAVRETSQSLVFVGAKVTVWGVPADKVHDPERGILEAANFGQPCTWPPVVLAPCEAGITPRPFLSNPSDCTAAPPTATVRINAWQDQDDWKTATSQASSPIDGCERLSFSPSLSVQNESKVPDSPTGLAVTLDLPQTELNPKGLSSPPLRDVKVTLPEGMTISPSSADGLAGCSDAQIAIGLDAPVTCPEASKIGTVVADTPVLPDPVHGSVFVGTQKSTDPASGQMFRMFLHLHSPERGINIKLPGQVRANPATGRLETTFDDNPQLPVSRIQLKLKGGPRAPLANPPTCGTKTAVAELSSWGGQEVVSTDDFTVDCPSAGGFAPEFVAGSTSPVGGAFSPFAVRIDRADREQYLSRIALDMPKGVLAKLAGVPLCPDAVANDGSPGVCPAGSRVGTATVGAGPGTSPLYLKGGVYLTGPYKGAPYGLAAQVHAKAGPFDLGWVKVRNALHVDPETAQASVASDPLPHIVKGVPVRLRSVNVDVDRPGFTINPTSCEEKTVNATLTSINGTTSKTSSRFQVGDCASLGFTPKLGMRLVGKKQMKSGGHPVLRAQLKQGNGQSNIRAAKVTLPPNVVLDSKNSVDPKLLCGYDASLRADCPASSIIGKASLKTPLLNKPLTGPVHFVQGIRFENGNRIRTLPTLLIKLRGEVSINLRSRTNTDSKDRLVSIFPSVPDARAAKFNLQINGGRKGILVVTENRRGRINLCNRKQTAQVETDGHNGKRADYPVRVKTSCAKKRKR